MEWIGLKIEKSGLVKLKDFAKAELSDEKQKVLADILDEIFVFTGVIGTAFELVDNKVFAAIEKHGVDALFPEVTPPSPS